MREFLAKQGGVLVLVILIVICTAAALIAFAGQGSMGIEERFSQALGLAPQNEGAGSGGDTPAVVEGDPVRYLAVALALAAVAGVLYARMRR